MNYTVAQLQSLALSVGFPASAAPTAAAIAMAESGGNPNAYGDASLGGSIGLWQIYTKAHPNFNASSLYDPTYNAQAAYSVSSGGTNWAPWSTWWANAATRTGPGQGVYRQYLTGFNPAPLPTSSQVLAATVIVAGSIAAAWWLTNARSARGLRRRLAAL
jgi:hypothetical protein